MLTPPPKATLRFGSDRLTIAEVMHMPEEQFKQWVQQLKAKDKSPSTGSGQAPLIGEMFVYNLNARVIKDAAK